MCRRGYPNWNKHGRIRQAQEITPVQQAFSDAHQFLQRIQCRKAPDSIEAGFAGTGFRNSAVAITTDRGSSPKFRR